MNLFKYLLCFLFTWVFSQNLSAQNLLSRASQKNNLPKGKNYFSPAKLTSGQKKPIFRFDFGPGKLEKGFTRIVASDHFSKDKGFGLISVGKIKDLASKNGDPLTSDGIASNEPFYFEVDLTEGNYRVDLIMGDEKEITNTTVKAESRRLMLENVITAPGKYIKKSIIINVRTPIINGKDSIRRKSREYGFLNWDNKLTLEFNGKSPHLNALEITKVTDKIGIFLAGNSTVVDQETEPWASWGQMVTRFFGSEVVIQNYAESGESLKSFKNENRLKKVKSLMKPGDYLFIEFAHNDQKPGANHVDAFTTYKEELRYFINVAHSKGGFPVLVTSMHRRRFDDAGKIINSLDGYPEAMRQTAREENIPLIDLNAMSKILFETLGEKESKSAFVHFRANTYPNQPEPWEDNTHFNNYGAYQLAKCIVMGIKKEIPALAIYLLEGLANYDPAHPDGVETWDFPASPPVNPVKPTGN